MMKDDNTIKSTDSLLTTNYLALDPISLNPKP